MATERIIRHFASTTGASYAPVFLSASGDNTVIAGVSGQTIRVLKLVLVSAGSVNAILKDGATAKSGSMPVPTAAWATLDLNSDPLILTAGNSFIINLSGAVAVSGLVESQQD